MRVMIWSAKRGSWVQEAVTCEEGLAPLQRPVNRYYEIRQVMFVFFVLVAKLYFCLNVDGYVIFSEYFYLVVSISEFPLLWKFPLGS